jgi:hypothetical protein
MIVRIAEEGQYELADDLHGKLNDLDDAAVQAADNGDEAAWKSTFDALIAFVRDEGTATGEDDLRPSDVILPPADSTFLEASTEFTGEGLVPDPEPDPA